MKKTLLSISLVFGLTAALLATGPIPDTQPQTGSTTFSGTSGLIITNTFSPVFASQPVVFIYPQTTNGVPYNVSGVTVSNFVLTATGYASTNDLVFWTAQPGYVRIYSGTNALAINTSVTNTFATPYAYAPQCFVSDSSTNGNAGASVSATNIVITVTAAENVFWETIGISYQPGATTVTY